MKRREFISATAAATLVAASVRSVPATTETVAIEEATIASLQALMSSGQATSRTITQAYLSRIGDVDKKLNSVIELNPDAVAIADAMDGERRSGKVRCTEFRF